MTISYRKTYQGAWELSTVEYGYRIHRQYMGYTKREATKLFKKQVKEIGKELYGK